MTIDGTDTVAPEKPLGDRLLVGTTSEALNQRPSLLCTYLCTGAPPLLSNPPAHDSETPDLIVL